MIGILYRMFFENIYLRRVSNLSSFNDKLFKLRISLSEAISYISQVIPPIFKERTLKTLKSVDDIRSMVDFYLADIKASDYKFRIDVFKKCLQMEEFDTVWKYDNKRLDTMYDIFYDAEFKNRNFMIGIVDYCEYPITALKTITDIKDTNIQITLRIDKLTTGEIGLFDLIRFMHETTRIINIKHIDDSLYLTIYDTNIYSDWCKYFDRWYYEYK